MKLAFIGTGKIIADALFAIEPIKEIEKTAIFARPHSKEKAEAFAKQYNIAEVYTDYEKLLTETQQIQFISVLLTVLTIPMQNRHFFTGKMSSLKNLLLAFIMRHRNCSRLQKRINYLFLRL